MAIISLTAIQFVAGPVFSQSNSLNNKKDSLNVVLLDDSNKKLNEIDLLRIVDSIKREELQLQLNSLKVTDNLKREVLQNQLQNLREKDAKSVASKMAKIDSLRNIVKGYPVLSAHKDTMFVIYSKMVL